MKEGISVPVETLKLDRFASLLKGVAPSCVTEIVSVNEPPLTVIVPLRGLVDVLTDAVTLIEPLLLPAEGDTLSHELALLLALQLILEVTLAELEPPPELKFIFDGDTDSVGVGVGAVTVTVHSHKSVCTPSEVATRTVLLPTERLDLMSMLPAEDNTILPFTLTPQVFEKTTETITDSP